MTAFHRNIQRPLSLITLCLTATLLACASTASPAVHATPAPALASSSPANTASGVATSSAIAASFTEAVDPATINAHTFIVKQGGATVAGAVSYDGLTATFLPAQALPSGSSFAASILGAKYLDGSGLSSNLVWTFTTTGDRALQSPVLLGTSGNYVILAETAITNVPTSAITGDIAISPAAESYLAGFSQTDATGYATAPQVVGKVYAADQAPPTPSNLTTAVSDMGTAYTDAAGRPTPDYLELSTGAIGGMTLTPGLYKWTSGVTIDADVTLKGGASDVWIFQTTGTLLQANGTKVLLSGGALARNIFWQVAGGATLGTTAHFEGILLSQTAIALQTGASMNGRALAQSAVTLDQNAVTQPAAPPDTTRPIVVSTNPAASAIAVVPATSITATFSEEMASATVTAATFTVAAGTQPISGSVTLSGSTATFHPAAPLAASTVVTATIGAGATDLAGNALAASYVWSFTTTAAPDTTPPTVVSTSPVSAAILVGLDASVSATFSESIAAASLTPATFTLTAGGQPIAGSVTSSGAAATFKPAAALAGSTVVTATLTTGVKDLAGNPLAANFVWSFTTQAPPDTTPPTVILKSPAAGATGVAFGASASATFSEPVAPLSAATFTLTAGGQSIAGSVTMSGNTATFQPAAALAPSTVVTATLTTGVKDLAGNALAANYVWSFTTHAPFDTTPPTIASTSPAAGATGVGLAASITVTFSEDMAPATLTKATFTVTGTAAVSGSVVYNAQTRVATFQPGTAFAEGTLLTAKIVSGASGVIDLAGNALAQDFTWTFTTGMHQNLMPVLLGTSGNYVILAETAITNVPTSAITGDVAISPAAESYIAGFVLTDKTGYATAPEVVGKIYAADQADPTPINLTTAINDMGTAYTDAAGRPSPDFLEYGAGEIGGHKLARGLYKWAGTVTVSSDVTLDGGANDVWIFQISGDLSQSDGTRVFLTGGAQAKNVFWQIAGQATLGTTSHFEGIILSQTAITLKTGASMNGRALAQSAVVLDTNAVTQPVQ